MLIFWNKQVIGGISRVLRQEKSDSSQDANFYQPKISADLDAASFRASFGSIVPL